MSVVFAETYQLRRLFHILITLLETLNFRKSYLTQKFFNLKSFPLVTSYICAFFDEARCNTCLIFSSNYIIYFYHISRVHIVAQPANRYIVPFHIAIS